MSRHRFARSFTVSIVAILVVFAIPLMHCSTNTAAPTDTGMSAAQLAANAGGSCNSSTNPNSPIICIASDGSATPNAVTVHARNNNAANPIVFKTQSGNGTLTISTSCSQISLGSGCGHGPVCNARTVTDVTGTCTYSASVDGAPAADPIIVTDQCCPASTDTLGAPTEHRH